MSSLAHSPSGEWDEVVAWKDVEVPESMYYGTWMIENPTNEQIAGSFVDRALEDWGIPLSRANERFYREAVIPPYCYQKAWQAQRFVEFAANSHEKNRRRWRHDLDDFPEPHPRDDPSIDREVSIRKYAHAALLVHGQAFVERALSPESLASLKGDA